MLGHNRSDHSLSTLLGNGDGSFTSDAEYVLGTSAPSIAAADLNGDGKLDLVIGYYNGLSVLLNAGDGRFLLRSDYASAGWTNSIIAVDLNHDDRLDIAAVGNGVLSVSANNGDGTLAARTDYRVGFDATGVWSADVDGDGTFTPQVEFGAGQYPRGVAAFDVNADGKPDLVSTVADGAISPLPNLAPPRVLDASFDPARRELRFVFD